MNRIDMSKKVVLYPEVPRGIRLGKYRGMDVYLDMDEDFEFEVGRFVAYGKEVKRGKRVLRQPVMEVSIGKEEFRNAYHIDIARTDYRYQGFGLMAGLYRYVMKKTGMVLQAGHMQSQGGRNLWLKLAKLPDVELFIAKKNKKELIPIEVNEDDDELVGVYDKPYNVHVVAMVA